MNHQTSKKRNVILMIMCMVILAAGAAYGDNDLRITTRIMVKNYQMADEFFRKGLSQLKNGTPEKAAGYFYKSIDKFPFFADAYFELSRIHYRKGDWEMALKNILLAKEKYPLLLNSHRDLQKEKLQAFKTEERRIDRALLKMYNETRQDCRYGVALGNLKNRKKYIENQIEKVSGSSGVNIHTSQPKYDFLHGNILVKLNQPDQAETLFEKTIAMDPDHPFAYNNLASLYYQKKRYRDALDVIGKSHENGMKVNEELKRLVVKKIQLDELKEVRSISGEFIVKKFKVNAGTGNDPFFVNTYLLHAPVTGNAIVIDPGTPSPALNRYIEHKKLQVVLILNTHGHGDHTGGNEYYSSRYNVPVMVHAKEKTMFSEETYPIKYVENESGYTVGEISFGIHSIPGHTPGSVCYSFENLLFPGDILFYNAIGKVNMPMGRKTEEDNVNHVSRDIFDTLGKLQRNTKIFPGHGINTDWQREKTGNPFLSQFQ